MGTIRTMGCRKREVTEDHRRAIVVALTTEERERFCAQGRCAVEGALPIGHRAEVAQGRGRPVSQRLTLTKVQRLSENVCGTVEFSLCSGHDTHQVKGCGGPPVFVELLADSQVLHGERYRASVVALCEHENCSAIEDSHAIYSAQA